MESDLTSESNESGVSPPTLPRVLGLFDATMIVVGSIIGSGIFLKVGTVDQALTGYGFLPVIAVWIGVGIVTLCGSLALGELSAMYPQAGGPYVYLREAYGRLPAFLWGWTEFWVVRTGSIGALACGTVIYLSELAPMPLWGQAAAAAAMIAGLSLVNVVGTRWGATVQNIATVAKVVFLGGLIVLPVLLGRAEPRHLQPAWSSLPMEFPELLVFGNAVGIAMIAVLWPYDGWINLSPVAEEIERPQRNAPLALMIGLGIVIAVYVGAVLSYHLTFTVDEVTHSEALAADVFRALFGSIGGRIAAIGVMCSTFGATNSNMIAGPRIYFAIARDGLIPAWIQRIHPVYRTPANSIIAQAIWTILLVFWFTIQIVFFTGTGTANPTQPQSLRHAFDGLTNSVVCAGLIFYGLVVAAVYVLRLTRPSLVRPYKTWGYPVTPALLLAAYCGAFVSLVAKDPKQVISVLGLIAAGFVYYLWASRR